MNQNQYISVPKSIKTMEKKLTKKIESNSVNLVDLFIENGIEQFNIKTIEVETTCDKMNVMEVNCSSFHRLIQANKENNLITVDFNEPILFRVENFEYPEFIGVEFPCAKKQVNGTIKMTVIC